VFRLDVHAGRLVFPERAELVRTDNGEHGDLLTPQARDAAITAGWEADRRRLHPGSMGTQESGQLSG
jgi:hypothetical protein